MSLDVKEIFYSLQGEGGRWGEASIFIRLSGCNLQCDFCDTDFTGGKEMTKEKILKAIKLFPCRWIVWTGGEPTLQLTDNILFFFQQHGYQQAIESNGSRELPTILDYSVISPKSNINYAKKINAEVDEVRISVRKNMKIPSLESLPSAKHYFLSPIFTSSNGSTNANIGYCVDYIKQHLEWRLSVQMHKFIGIN